MRFVISLIALLLPSLAFAAFPDVPASHRNAEGISYVQEQGIVAGYPDGTYQPGRTINRAEFTKIIVSAISDPTGIEKCAEATGFSGHFPDIPSGAWFEPYVCTARLLGLIDGYPDGTFRPEQTINFVESSKILSLSFELYAQSDDAVWYKGYVEALARQYAIPVSITAFDVPLTRGDMAEMVWRLHAQNRGEPSLTYEELQGETADTQEKTPLYTQYTDGVIGNGETSVLFFHAQWCPYCREDDAFLQDFYQSGIPTLTTYKVDYDTEKELKKRYGITYQHTFVLIDGSGNELENVLKPNRDKLRDLVTQ